MGPGDSVGIVTQGVARGLALPWAIFCRAFGPLNQRQSAFICGSSWGLAKLILWNRLQEGGAVFTEKGELDFEHNRRKTSLIIPDERSPGFVRAIETMNKKVIP